MNQIEEELDNLRRQLVALRYMKKCREDEIKLIDSRVTEIHIRMGVLENVQGSVRTVQAAHQGNQPE